MKRRLSGESDGRPSTMILYILRHGIAVDRSDWKKSDQDRPLTKDGIRKMKKVARGMHEAGVKFDVLLTSPFQRAFDTAEIVAQEYNAEKKLKVLNALTPDGDAKALLRYLSKGNHTWESVLLVGHEPYLSRLISVLITGRDDIDLDLRKGGLVRLATDSPTYGRCATLQAWLPPRILRRLA